jgi:hypothetical protein
MPPRVIRVVTETPVATSVVVEPSQTVRVSTVAPAPEQVVVNETELVVIDHPGTQGIPGPTGPMGENAYQLALDEGFVGTEAQWLATLVGPIGPQGPQGVPGAVVLSGSAYVHEQYAPDTTWAITHNLGFYPNVTTVDSANTRIEGDLNYIDSLALEVRFSVPIGGRAYLS